MARPTYVTPGDFGTTEWANSVVRRANVGWLWRRSTNRTCPNNSFLTLNSVSAGDRVYAEGVFLTDGGVPSTTDTDATQILSAGVYEIGASTRWQSGLEAQFVLSVRVNGSEPNSCRQTTENQTTVLTPGQQLSVRLDLSAGDLVSAVVYMRRFSGTASADMTDYSFWGNLIREAT